MIAPTSFRLSSATRAQVRDLAAEYNGNQTTALAVAIDRMWREGTMSTEHITAAQLIREYHAPAWLVEPIGEPSEPDDIAAINAAPWRVLQTGVAGWGEYNAIIRVANESVPALGTYYLARLA